MKTFQYDEIGKLYVRLTVGILIMFHGVAKLMHPESLGFIDSSLANAGLPSEFVYGVYIGELLAPLMVVFGVYARIGGLMILVNMVFAIWLMHANDVFVLTPHGGWALELQAFYLMGGLSVLLLGSGKYAIKPD